MLRVLGAVVTRGPRTLKYYGNPQILDGRLEVRLDELGRCGVRQWTWNVTSTHSARNW